MKEKKERLKVINRDIKKYCILYLPENSDYKYWMITDILKEEIYLNKIMEDSMLCVISPYQYDEYSEEVDIQVRHLKSKVLDTAELLDKIYRIID